MQESHRPSAPEEAYTYPSRYDICYAAVESNEERRSRKENPRIGSPVVSLLPSERLHDIPRLLVFSVVLGDTGERRHAREKMAFYWMTRFDVFPEAP